MLSLLFHDQAICLTLLFQWIMPSGSVFAPTDERSLKGAYFFNVCSYALV